MATDELKTLVANSVFAIKNLVAYADKNPDKVKELRQEILGSLERSLKMRLMSLFF